MDQRYKLVAAATVDRLSDSVSQMMTEGWEPSGSPFWQEKSLSWYQAMIRTTAAPSPNTTYLREPKRR